MFNRIIQPVEQWLSDLQFRLTVAVVIAVFAGTGLGFLLAAAYMAIALALPAPIAALLVGSGLVLLALIMLPILRSRSHRRAARRPREPEPLAYRTSEPDAGTASTGTLLHDAGDWARRHTGPASIAALAAGLAFGASPMLRRVVVGLAFRRVLLGAIHRVERETGANK